MEEIVFHHTLPIQLRFNDVDKFGHVNNTVYFSFYDLGKTEYFASVCPGVDWEKTGIVVVHIEADFVKQIFASDHIAVQTAVSEVGTKSFHLLQRVIDTKTNEIKCICKSIMVTFDLERHESMPLTEEWIEAICKYEGIVVVHIEADFVKQIFASDHIAVQTAVSEVGTKSFHLLQRVIDTKTNEIKCICKSIMVTFDLERHESMPLTEEWIEAICKYEGRDLRKKK